MRLSKADEIAREFAIKVEKLIQGFIEKYHPLLSGVLTTLVTLLFTYILSVKKAIPFHVAQE
jgi:hypothetical protein